VVTGLADLWEQSIHLSCIGIYGSYTWSPCGRFVAAFTDGDVEVRDARSSELVSTLTGSGVGLDGELIYSPDGHLLAHLSNSLVIWDMQTGGIAKEVQCDMYFGGSMVWSLDGKMIGITKGSAVHVYDVASGTMQSIGTLQSHDKLYLWTHNGSFRTMATGLDGQGFTIEIFEVGSDLTRIESFHFNSWGLDSWIESFSPTTYQISVQIHNQVCILDIQNSECLLEEGGCFKSHCFSSDGSLFAACLRPNTIHIWKYTSGCYTLWRKLPSQFHSSSIERFPPQFSPDFSSIVGCFGGILRVHHLDGYPIVASADSHTPLAVLSHCGSYMVTGHQGNGTVTINNLHLGVPPQLVDTDMWITMLALTGNILLVLDSGTIVAWRLIEGGMVDGTPTNGRAGRGNSIWAVSVPHYPSFIIKDQFVTIKAGNVTYVYHTGTGEVLKLTLACFDLPGYTPWDMYYGQHYPHYCKAGGQGILPGSNWPAPLVTLQVPWVKDPGGKHRLWVPVEWRMYNAGWLYNVTTLWLNRGRNAVIIKL